MKQESFVQELIKGKSQRESYKAAGYKTDRMSEKTIDEAACRLMKNSKVLARYEELNDRLIKEAEDECIVDGKRVLKELVNIAFADTTDYAQVITTPRKRRIWDEELNRYVYDEQLYGEEQFVTVTDTGQLPANKRAAIKSIKQGRHGIEIELYSKDKALELLGKHLKLFTESLEIKDNSDNPFKGLTTEELKKALGLS